MHASRQQDWSNRTQYVSFENCTLNAYVNPVLQVLYMLRGIRSVALQAQASAFHHSNPFSLWGELGFLFHMINLIATSSKDVPRVVTANNFQLSFRQSPEALALGKSFSPFHLSIYSSIHLSNFARTGRIVLDGVCLPLCALPVPLV